ncbi:MAG TPA: vitamin K epoxide reductase family protein [Candidatus Babeliales bacterium]|nr:vitamin K epoxide reductase family protein [Candidatus Babeliales bacterium]
MIIIIGIIGLVISVYGIFVERKLKQDINYKAACDISDKISCTRPLLSSYAAMLGISNIWASALYYCAIIIMAILQLKTMLFITSCAGVIVSVIFAYILYFKIRSFCLICTSLYIVNIALLTVSYFS